MEMMAKGTHGKLEKSRSSVLKDQLKSFLDTSVVIKQRAGHSAHRAILSATIPIPHYVNNYVRMEFYKALLLDWTRLYFESGESFHPTFGDALLFYSDRFGRGPKTVLTALGNLMTSIGFFLSETRDKENCRQKLQDLIFELALEFERCYRDTGDDPTRCARLSSPLKLPEPQMRDEALLEFQKTFEAVEECRKHCTIDTVYRRGGKYKIEKIEELRHQSLADKRVTRLSGLVHEALENSAKITCWSCAKMGDATIGASMPAGWRLHSLDTLHEPVCQALAKDCQVHPSAAQVKKEA